MIPVRPRNIVSLKASELFPVDLSRRNVPGHGGSGGPGGRVRPSLAACPGRPADSNKPAHQAGGRSWGNRGQGNLVTAAPVFHRGRRLPSQASISRVYRWREIWHWCKCDLVASVAGGEPHHGGAVRAVTVSTAVPAPAGRGSDRGGLPAVVGGCPALLSASIRHAVRAGGGWQEVADRVAAV